MADLDPRQQAAVAAGPVDLFVAAGAGSGKTRVLSTRFVDAVLGRGPYRKCAPDELLAVTYTEKAASELAERIRGALSAAGDAQAARAIGEAWIATIHGMCSRILRQHALRAGIDPHFAVLDAVESSALEAEALEDVVRASLEADAALTVLLDTYGFDQISSAAQSVRAKMHALGLPVGSLHTVGLEECRRALLASADTLRHMADEFESLRQIATVQNNRAAVLELAAAIHGAAEGLPGTARDILSAACACSVRQERRVEGHEELVEACKLEIERVREAAAQLLVQESERAFVAFVVRLDEEYSRRKDERGALDFEDLQLKTAELLERHTDVASRYRSRFAMLMLDEFQDTNELQLRIIEALAEGNLCTVGDENQSIYAFRHADVEVFRSRGRRCEQEVSLDINYRTHPDLLATINGLFSHPSMLGPAFMQLQAPESDRRSTRWPASEPRFQARFIDQSSGEGSAKGVEAHRVAERVVELLAGGLEPRDVAVLMRALSGGRAAGVEAALMARGIPVYIASGGSFFEQPEVVETRALLAVIANVWDDAALAIVLAGRITGLSPEGLIALRARADVLAVEQERHRRDVHLWEAVVSLGAELGPHDGAALERTSTAIEEARRLRGTRSLADSVLDAVLALDFDLVLFSNGRHGERAWANVAKLARLAAEYESATGGDLASFLEYLQLREMHATSEQEATIDGEANAVRVMSIHAAKGLEFPAVIVAGLTSPGESGPVYFGRVSGVPTLGMTLPWHDKTQHTIGSARVRDAARAAADAEAVRLLYVACTRAEEGLTLIARTDPEKDAGDSLGDLVRTALGKGAAESLGDGRVTVGAGEADVRVVERVAEPAAEPRTVLDHSCPPWELGISPTAEPPRNTATVPSRLSYTGLATYGRCPQRFFLTSIAKLPAPPAAREGEALAFGDAVHRVIAQCTRPDIDPNPLLASAARAAGLDHSAVPRLESAVRTFLGSSLAGEVFGSAEVQREAPITVPVGSAVLVGAIDCIGWVGDAALIVDYKTGNAPLTEDEARARYQLQGECYALAAFAAGARSVRVVFAELERGREIAYRYAEADSDGIRTRISELIEQMGRDGYPPRPSYDQDLCETCPGLGGVCSISRPTRDVAG